MCDQTVTATIKPACLAAVTVQVSPMRKEAVFALNFRGSGQVPACHACTAELQSTLRSGAGLYANFISDLGVSIVMQAPTYRILLRWVDSN